MPKKVTFLFLIVFVLSFSGFEKLSLLEDFRKDQTLEAWMNETASLSISQAFQQGGFSFVQFSSVVRESDQVQHFYAKTDTTPASLGKDPIYLELISEEVFLAAQKKANVNFLSDPFKSRLETNAVFFSSASQKYQPNRLRQALKTADQLILDGHILGLMTRPVSSSFRLMTWMGGTAEDVLLQDISRYFENQEIPPLYEGEGMDVEVFEEHLNQVFGDSRAKGTMRLFIGGEEYFPRQIQAFEEARNKIDVRIFIFDNDDFGVSIADVLKRRSKEIHVRVLLDGMGIIMGEGKVPETLPDGFIPPSSMVDYLKKDSSVQVRVRPNTWFKADHTKTIFIDEKICFTGGMNIGREYRYDWHDLMVELRGPIVQKLLNEFEAAWSHAGKLGDLAYFKTLVNTDSRILDTEKGFLIRPLYTRAKDQQIYEAQLEAIKYAKKYIYISNAYFSDNAILYELIRARRRGVDVRVILPIHGNHEIMNKSNVVTANVMFENGIRVYFYPGMSHIKAAIYDGWLTTGSANFDKLSFRDNVELNIAASDAATVQEMKERLFEADFKKSLEMTEPLKVNFQDRLAEFLAEQL